MMAGKAHKNIFSSAALIALIALGGCTFDRLGPAAPFFNFGTKSNPAGTIIARDGDTIEKLAARYNVNAAELISANNLSAPYKLSKGQRLALPRPREYKVQPKDTLYNVARLFNIAPLDLAQYNGLPPPYALNAGQILRIPGNGQNGFNSFTIEEAQPLEPQKVDPVEIENLKSSQKKQAAQKVFAANVQPSSVQELPVAEALSAMIKSVAAGEIADAKPVNMPKTPQISKTPSLSAAAMVTAKSNPLYQPAVMQTTITPAAKSGYVWPVRGKIISSYGPKTGNLFNDGINIAAPRGTPVQAAADGIVAYVGSDLSSYGNMVLIRHGNGVMTAYAHMQNIIVKKGEAVKMGRVIGAVGSSGSVSNSQLHFEIRQGRKSIDPGPYLGVSS